MNVLHLDFETRSACDLRKAGAEIYARHSSTDILCMGWAFDDEPIEIWTPGKLIPIKLMVAMATYCDVVAHNAPFELAIWNNVGVRKYNWPVLQPERMTCTMAMAYAMALPGSLEKAAAAAGIKAQKDTVGSRIMMQLAQPREIYGCAPACPPGCPGHITWYTPESHPEKFKALYSYCKQDIEVERELYKRLLPLSPSEKELWQLDYKINQRGIQIDIKAVKTAISIVEAEKNRLDLEIKRVTKNQVATCTATGQLTTWLRFRGLKLEGVAKADVANLLEDPALPSDCRAALLLRQEAAKSSTAKLESMLNSTSTTDGRIRGIFQYHGAATGRWAGRRIQPQNFPRPKMSDSEIENVFKLLGEVK